MGQLDPTETDHMQRHHYLMVKAVEYDVCLVWYMFSDLMIAKRYLKISADLFTACKKTDSTDSSFLSSGFAHKLDASEVWKKSKE